LDAHFNTSEPTYKELVFIKEHKIKTHTILIDDMSLYFNLSHIEKTLKGLYEPDDELKIYWRDKPEVAIV
jgi:hypothetical protein